MAIQKKKIFIYETFAGIGTQLLSLKKAAINENYEIVSCGAIEWYVYAIISYEIIHYGLKEKENHLSSEEIRNTLNKYVFSNDSKNPVNSTFFLRLNETKLRTIFPYLNYFLQQNTNNFTDITKVTKIPKNIDIFTYSFPCQDLSQQGKQKGIIEGSRSGLLFQIENILKLNKDQLPRILLMENVKALSTFKFKKEFKRWRYELKKLGYTSKFKVLNASNYGSCQNRERLFMISSFNLKGFRWPRKRKNNNCLSNIIKRSNKDIDLLSSSEQKLQKYCQRLSLSSFKKSLRNVYWTTLPNYTTFISEALVYLPKGFGPTLTATGANSRLKFYWFEMKTIFFINAFEAYLYMGFDKKIAEKIINTNILTEQQMIFTCGNAISIEVLTQIFKSVIKMFKYQEKT